MVYVLAAAFLMLASLVGVLIWLRFNRNRAQQLNERLLQGTGSLSASERWQSFEVMVGGAFLAVLALFERVDDASGQLSGFKPAEQPGFVMLLLAAYLLLCGLIFLIRPHHIAKLYFGIGLIGQGLLGLASVGLVAGLGASVRTLHGSGIDRYLTSHWWIVALFSFFLIAMGLQAIRSYHRERAAEQQIFATSRR